jgi:hypothetical protein
VQKGAHFIAAAAFMFASTNLVIELGMLILISTCPRDGGHRGASK